MRRCSSELIDLSYLPQIVRRKNSSSDSLEGELEFPAFFDKELREDVRGAGQRDRNDLKRNTVDRIKPEQAMKERKLVFTCAFTLSWIRPDSVLLFPSSLVHIIYSSWPECACELALRAKTLHSAHTTQSNGHGMQNTDGENPWTWQRTRIEITNQKTKARLTQGRCSYRSGMEREEKNQRLCLIAVFFRFPAFLLSSTNFPISSTAGAESVRKDGRWAMGRMRTLSSLRPPFACAT